MEAMSSPETILRTEPVRPLKRVEYERLVSEGFFDDERVRGDAIAMAAFPDVTIAVAEILPPVEAPGR